MLQDTSNDVTESRVALRAKYSSALLLRRLNEHHNYNVIPPLGWTKREPVETVEPPVDWEDSYFEAMQSTAAPAPKRDYPLIEDIQRAVANHYSASKIDMVSARKTADIVRPRQIAMYLSKRLTLRSLPDIGRRFGGRDHSTVHHAVRKIERLCETDTTLVNDIEFLKGCFQ